ncbi:MAG TPA: tetratricopeptide repeat protein, partial [Verrucomicrobiae bacterium]|nr:tetratricopeptide repeat protein [Verrucomicrobiae bacterium]
MSRPRIVGLLLALVTLLVYLPAAHHTFVMYDDGDYITENLVVQNGLTWAGFKWAFTTWHASNWHPLTWISHMADCQMFALNAGGHHLVSALFHAVNAALLFVLLLRLTSLRADAPARQAGAFWASAFVAALFAWHPMHVESVAWAAERKDVLSTFFELLALLAYARYAGLPKGESSKPKVFYALALVMFACALMSKPMPVTMPFVMLLLDYWPLKRISFPSTLNSQLSTILEKIPFFLLSAASCAVTYISQRTTAVVSLKGMSLHLRLENVLVSYGRYLLKLFWPENLAVIYPLSGRFPWWQLTLAIAALVLISWFAWRERRRFAYLPVGWLWFLGTLVPVIGLVQVGSQALADRYSYFPSIGIFIAVAFGARDLAERFQSSKIIIAAAAASILAACLVLTEKQLSYWRNDESLFRHAVVATGDNEIAHGNLAAALERQGRKTEAIAEYREALRIYPKNSDNHNNLASIFDSMGDTNAALAEYQEAIKLDPKSIAPRDNLGTFFIETGRLDDAMKQYAETARLEPKDAHPYYLMGKLLLREGRDGEAIQQFRKAAQFAPDDFQMLTYMARVLASDENAQARNGNTAYMLASKANALTDGVQPAMLDTLAM